MVSCREGMRDRNAFYWGETVQADGSEDTVFFRIPDVGCKVCQFSIPGQEIVKVYPSVHSARRYIVTDQYVFYGSNMGTIRRFDLETDTCRILYSTGNSHAKILGYQSGVVYCLYDGIIDRKSLEEGNREHIVNLSEGDWFPEMAISFCKQLYCFNKSYISDYQ